jgi:hypothetical protein
MKKLLVTFALLIIAFYNQAQVPGFNIGPKIGYNTRKFSTDLDVLKSDPDGAFQFGVFARIGKKIYVQPEVNYVIKGGQVSITGEDKVKIKLKTVTIPVLLGYRVVNAKIFNIRFMAGPAISLILDKNVPANNLVDFPIKTKDDLKDSIWSIQLGGGVDLLNFTFDLRYEIGVDNMYTGDNFSIRNNLLNISLGYKLL